jgi:hypothetical protein
MFTWSLEFADDQGRSGSIRLTVPAHDAPAGASCAFSATLTIPDGGVVVVRDDEVPVPRRGSSTIRADALWAELVCETPGEHWSFGLEAFGLRVDTAAEAATAEVGERVAVGYDLEWETPDRVVGELLVGRETIPIDARGTFTHPRFGASGAS